MEEKRETRRRRRVCKKRGKNEGGKIWNMWILEIKVKKDNKKTKRRRRRRRKST